MHNLKANARMLKYCVIKLKRYYEELQKCLDKQQKKLFETYEGNCIILHLFCGYTWQKISRRIGNGLSKDAIRHRCKNLEW